MAIRASIVTVSGALLAVALACAPAAARIYKWVDENGVTQYTQQPPPRGTAEEITPAPAPSVDPAAARQELQERLDAFNKRREERARQARETEEERAFREKLTADCQRLRENLEVMRNNPRLLEEQDDGTRRRLGEEERQARMQQFSTQLREHCSDV